MEACEQARAWRNIGIEICIHINVSGRELEQDGFYEELTKKTTYLLEGVQAAADKRGIAFTTAQVGGMFGLFFTEQNKVTSFAEVVKCDGERFKKFFHLCLDRGVYLAPSSFEAGFVLSAGCVVSAMQLAHFCTTNT